MAGSFAETTRLKLRRLLGTSLVSDVDEGFQRLAEDCDTKTTGYSEGTLEARPAAGYPNRLYRVTSGTGIGLYMDNGSTWETVFTLDTSDNYGSGAETTRTLGTAFTPDANRPVFLRAILRKGGNGGTMELKVLVGPNEAGLKTVGEEFIFCGDSGVTTAINGSISHTVIVPPGHLVRLDGGITGAGTLSATTRHVVL